MKMYVHFVTNEMASKARSTVNYNTRACSSEIWLFSTIFEIKESVFGIASVKRESRDLERDFKQPFRLTNRRSIFHAVVSTCGMKIFEEIKVKLQKA